MFTDLRICLQIYTPPPYTACREFIAPGSEGRIPLCNIRECKVSARGARALKHSGRMGLRYRGQRPSQGPTSKLYLHKGGRVFNHVLLFAFWLYGFTLANNASFAKFNITLNSLALAVAYSHINRSFLRNVLSDDKDKVLLVGLSKAYDQPNPKQSNPIQFNVSKSFL